MTDNYHLGNLGKRYKILKKGDLIIKGDEFYSPSVKDWLPSSAWRTNEHHDYLYTEYTYRRLVPDPCREGYMKIARLRFALARKVSSE